MMSNQALQLIHGGAFCTGCRACEGVTSAPGAFMALRSTLFVAACSAIVLRSSSRWAASSTGQAVGSRGRTSYRARRFIMDSSRPSSLAKAALRFSNSVCLRALRSDVDLWSVPVSTCVCFLVCKLCCPQSFCEGCLALLKLRLLVRPAQQHGLPHTSISQYACIWPSWFCCPHRCCNGRLTPLNVCLLARSAWGH